MAVSDENECATIARHGQAGQYAGWWHAYGDVIPGWLEPYLGLEAAASLIRSYETQFRTGLLQPGTNAHASSGPAGRPVGRTGRSGASACGCAASNSSPASPRRGLGP